MVHLKRIRIFGHLFPLHHFYRMSRVRFNFITALPTHPCPMNGQNNCMLHLLDAGQVAEFYGYPGDNHNISINFGSAMARSIAFFDAYVKGTE